jgi:alkylation response protein AidB-like acyl-CoA dehydrogenase
MTDTKLSPEEAEAFAARCREFLEANTEYDGTRRNIARGRAFQAALTEAGLAGLAYDKEYGGAGLTPEHDRIYRQTAGGFPAMANDFVISHGMCLPMLNEFGTEEQKRQFMPDNRRCGPPSPTSPTTASSSPAPTPTSPSTPASRCSSST